MDPRPSLSTNRLGATSLTLNMPHTLPSFETNNMKLPNLTVKSASPSRHCATCLANYSSANWYKDKLRSPGHFMCKSCYVCLNRKKTKSLVPTVRRRRKPLIRDSKRWCENCDSRQSSGDWYRGSNGFVCQKCYQRKNRLKKIGTGLSGFDLGPNAEPGLEKHRSSA